MIIVNVTFSILEEKRDYNTMANNMQIVETDRRVSFVYSENIPEDVIVKDIFEAAQEIGIKECHTDIEIKEVSI